MQGLQVDFSIVAPMLAVGVAALVVLILELVLPHGESDRYVYPVGLLGLLLALWYLVDLWGATGDGVARLGFSGALGADGLSIALSVVIVAAAGLSLLLSCYRRQPDPASFTALALWTAAGMMILVGAANLLVLFLGLELLSLGLYVLVGIRQQRLSSQEAAFKYLALGSISSGFLLFGLAFVYGSAGSVSLAAVSDAWATVAATGMTPTGLPSGFLTLGYVLVLIGFAFKLGLVPFHLWIPDVYEGAPTPVTAFMAVGTKAAAFGALARLLLAADPAAAAAAVTPLWVLAALSMIVGTTGAIRQENLKRLLGYSSVAHAGYLLVVLPGLGMDGVAAAVFYLIAYLFTNMGAFAVIAWLTQHGEDGARLDAYRGLFRRHPWPAALMALFLLSLAGIPPSAGFTGKFLVLSGGMAAGGWWLGLCLVVTTVVSLYAYLKVIVAMLAPVGATLGVAFAASPTALSEVAAASEQGDAVSAVEEASAEPAQPVSTSREAALIAVMCLCAAGTLWLGLWPQAAWAFSRRALGLG